MQLFVTSLAVMATAALASLVPRVIDTTLCVCPRIGKDLGTHINDGPDWYQCAYASEGACTWNTTVSCPLPFDMQDGRQADAGRACRPDT